MNEYWADHPPVHTLVAAYIGYEPKAKSTETDSLHEAAEFIPVNTLNKSEFDDLLRQHGLPTGE